MAPERFQSTLLATAIIGIFGLLLVHALTVAAPVLIPITLAILASFLFAPAIRKMRSLRVPSELGAGFIVLVLLSIMASSVYILSAPAENWLRRAPVELRNLEYELRAFREPIEKVQKATEQVAELATIKNDGPQVEVKVTRFSFADFVLQGTPAVVASTILFVVFLFFLLAYGSQLQRRVVASLPSFGSKKVAVRIVRSVQRDVAAYLVTISLINAVLGILVAGLAHVLGMPNPILWGVLAGLFNYAPYVGAMITAVVLAFVALLTFESALQALVVPLAFLSLTTIEGQFVTPMLLGRRLALNPLLVLLSLALWGWLWGIVGVLIAVPMLAVVKIVAEQVAPLRPLSILLGRG